MFGTFVKYQFQRTYDAILAAPVDTEELVTAEALWIAARAGVYGCAPLLVAMVFGLEPSWGMLLVPFIGVLAGFGWACFGITVAALAEVDRQLQLRHQRRASRRCSSSPARSSRSPAARVGAGARAVQPALPLRRSSSATPCFGFEGWIDLYHVGALTVFALITWRLAIHYMGKKLVD